MIRKFVLALLCASVPIAASASDAWVVLGRAATRKDAILDVRWEAGVVLHNVGDTAARVAVVAGSDGVAPATAEIPGGQALAIFPGDALGGDPPATLWILRLDVPSQVRVEGRIELWNQDRRPTGAPPPFAPYTKLAMPVFNTLVPAGETQFHFGTDLAGQRSRLNVAIYNAGPIDATARVTLRAAFCSASLVEQTAVVPANRMVQIALPATPPAACASGWVQSLRVVVDQPSLSLVSVLSTEAAPDASVSIIGTR